MGPSRRVHDAGLTLIEVLITMILMGVVSSLVVAAVAQAGRIVTHTGDEEAGLQDAKVILDRIGRDIRESRGAECGTDLTMANCDARLQLWIDGNSNYLREEDEVVIWRLEPNGDGIHSDVWRTVGTGVGGTPVTSRLQASSLVVDALFTYDEPIANDVQQVRVSMVYDALQGAGAGERRVDFSVRLRNKG